MTNYEYLRDNGRYKSENLSDMAIEMCTRNHDSCRECCSDGCDRALTETRDWLMLEKAVEYSEEPL